MREGEENERIIRERDRRCGTPVQTPYRRCWQVATGDARCASG
jgi:hypothetical protein